MRLIGVSGKVGSGKDTTHELLAGILEENGYTTTKISFASKLKDAATMLFDWDRERLESDFDYKEGDTLDDGSPDPACQALGMTRRVFMQRFGTEAMRDNIHRDFWVILVKLAIEKGEYDDYDIGFFTDMRFINEINLVKEKDGLLIQVNRKGDATTLTEHTQHLSELEWEQWTDWDHIITNNVNPKLSKDENLQRFREYLSEEVLFPHFDIV